MPIDLVCRSTWALTVPGTPEFSEFFEAELTDVAGWSAYSLKEQWAAWSESRYQDDAHLLPDIRALRKTL